MTSPSTSVTETQTSRSSNATLRAPFAGAQGLADGGAAVRLARRPRRSEHDGA